MTVGKLLKQNSRLFEEQKRRLPWDESWWSSKDLQVHERLCP